MAELSTYRVVDLRHVRGSYEDFWFDDAVSNAKKGDTVLWVCYDPAKWRKKFIAAGCSARFTHDGVEVGPGDPAQ